MKRELDVLSSPARGFEEIKEIDENSIEFWRARNLFPLFGYSRWEDFKNLINRAKKAAFKSGQQIENHFRDLTKMVQLGSNSLRKVKDYKLDRYACYLIAQNGDPKISQIALAQTYFAIQTRRQEIQQLENLSEVERRLLTREQVTTQNKILFSTAKKSGVNNFGSFNDAGYRGLYGIPLGEIEKRKKLKKGELLDRSGAAELAANLFRITQTEEKLRNDNVNSQYQANSVHNMVGGKIRQTIKDIQGVLPENMKPVKHIKEVKKELKLLQKQKKNKML